MYVRLRRSSGSSIVPALFFAPIALAACGSPPPPATPPAPVAAPVQTVAAPVDVSPVDEPKDLLVVARMNKPSESLRAIFGWAGMGSPESEDVSELVAGEKVGALVDLEQPIDFAITMKMHGAQPKPLGAISAAVKSMDDAKAALSKFKLVPGSNGSFKIEGLGKVGGDDGESGDERSCALVPAFGPATTRIVCGDSDASLEALAPYLARSFPRTTFPSDIHIEVRLAPVQPFVEKQKRLIPLLLGSYIGVRSGNAGIDDAVKAAFGDLADFALDANRVSLDAMVAEGQGSFTLTAGFRSTTSLLARLAVSHPERAAAPPAAFWKLPGDADCAFFNGGIDAADFASPRDRITAIVAGQLQKDGLADADRKPLVDATTHTLDLFSSSLVVGKGVDVAVTEKALAGVKAATKDDATREEAERVAAEAAAGWTLIGVEQPAAKVVSIAKEWPAAWSRPGVQKWLRSQVEGAAPPSIAIAPAPKSLPKDSAHIAITIRRPHHADPKNAKGKSAKAPATKPLVLHLLVVPDGSRTWLAFAADQGLAEAKIKEVMSGQSLAGRSGLASMHDARMNAGGFVSTRGIFEGTTFGWTLSPRWQELHRDVFAGLASGPEGGATPIPFSFAARGGQGEDKAGSFVAQVTVPKAAIADVVRVALGMR